MSELSPRQSRILAEQAMELRALRGRLSRVERSQDTRLTTLRAGDGRGLQVVDEEGAPILQIGGSDSGAGDVIQHVGGPTPEPPSAPLLEAGASTITVSVHDAQPSDLRLCRVHAGLSEDFTVGPGSVVGSIPAGSVSTVVGVPAGVWSVRVQWVTLSGQVSDPSDVATVDVEPLVDTDDIQAVLDTAQDRLDEAKVEWEAAQSALESRTAEAEADLDDARTRLATAESTLAPLPGDLADAKTAAQEAADAAIAAEARATEANNRAMTRLANGNFEDGLKYWDTSYGVGPGLTTDSHSGEQAAWFGSNRQITPESYLPVVEGQIWELQYYYKARNEDGVNEPFHATFRDQNGAMVGGSWNVRTDASLTEWKSSGSVRYTVEPGVDSIKLLIGRVSTAPLDAEWIIDDVVLRDVTDVVRLELAAQEAKQAGIDAQSKADFVELQLDGIDTRLGDAEQALIDAGVEGSTNLATLEQRLTTAFQQADTEAKNAAIAAAASDATTKANAARDAAEAEALLLAQAEAQAAQSAAEATAAADALAKANAARDAAISSSAADATSKAEAAEQAAKTAAAADAKAKADAAQAEAIRLAAIDAQDKADAAQAEALRLAKLDATEKANVAKSEALAGAAVDAQEKADAARDYAKAVAGQAENIIPDPNVRTEMWDFFTGGIVHTEGGPTVGMIEVPAGNNTYAFPLTRELGKPVTTSGSGWVVPVKEGQVWEVEAWYRTTEDYAIATSNYSGLRLGRDAANTFITRPAGQTAKNTEWTQMKARWTVPAGTTGVQLWVFQSHTAGRIFWADFSMKDVTALVAAEQALADAQNRADDAHDAAGVAWNHADAAMTSAVNAKSDAIAHADALPKVLHGTTAPSGTAPDGSTWEQHAGPGLATPVVAKWTRVNGSWQSTPIDGKAVSNMDIGYLTAGGATIAEAVIDKLYARMVAVNDVFARRMVISNGNLWPDPEFERGAVPNWEVSAGGIETTSNGTSGVGGYSNRLTVRVKPGETYLFSILRSSARGDTGSGNVSMNIETWADGESSRISYTSHSMVGLGEHLIEYTVPNNGADFIRFGFYAWGGTTNLPAGTRVRLTDFTMTRMSDAVLIKDGAITADKITVTDKLITDIFGANRALIEDELVVEGDIFGNNADLISAAMKSLTVTEKATFAAAFADQFWAKMAVIQKLKAESAWITDAMVSSLTGEKVTVTQEFWARLGQFVEIEAGMIKANAFQGQTFTGGTFTGTTFQTDGSSTPAAVLDSIGMTSYGEDIYGTPYRVRYTGGSSREAGVFFQTGAGGTIGQITASATGYREVNFNGPVGAGTGSNDRPRIRMTDVNDGELWITGVADATGIPSEVWLHKGTGGMRAGAGASTASVNLSQHEAALSLGSNHGVHVQPNRVVLRGDTVAENDLQATTFTSSGQADLNGLTNIRGKANLMGGAEVSGGSLVSGVQASFNQNVYANARLVYAGHGLTTNNANVFMDSAGSILRVSSASRYKLDQQEIDIPDAILDLPVKDWIDRAAVDRLAELAALPRPLRRQDQIDLELAEQASTTRVIGLVAEDVAAIEPRLATYGPDGNVDGVAYDRVGLSLIPVVRRHRDRIKSLEAENELLRDRLAKIEQHLGL